jgi:hypothetical protein
METHGSLRKVTEGFVPTTPPLHDSASLPQISPNITDYHPVSVNLTTSARQQVLEALCFTKSFPLCALCVLMLNCCFQVKCVKKH